MSPSKDTNKAKKTAKSSKTSRKKVAKKPAQLKTSISNDKPENSSVPNTAVKSAKKTKKTLSIGQSIFGYFFTILVSIFFAVLITLVVIPLAMRVNPIAFYNGDFLTKNKNPKTIIQTKKGENLVTAVAKKVKPSVVTISVIKSSAKSLFFPELSQEEEVSGSGVIFRKDGYIITNNHVVEDAKEISVTIGDLDDVKGKLIAGDAESDIAIVKINKNNLPAADIGSTKNTKVGELAVAIGTPFRFQHSVTAGIISAKNRSLGVPDTGNKSQKTLTDMVQTDAAINPGNSGGALANAKGEVIGINTVIASTSGSSAGIGFAIPIERAMNIANQLITSGKASHPYIGVSIKTVTEDIAKERGIPQGIWVLQVMAKSPADKAGLEGGDVIIKINGKKVDEADELITEIRRSKVGNKIKLTFVRKNKEKTVAVKLAEKPSRLTP